MKKEDISRAIDEIDGAYIEGYFHTKDKLKRRRRFKSIFIPLAAAFMCALIICTAVLNAFRGNGAPDGKLIIMDASCKNSVNVNGVAAKYTGNSLNSEQGIMADPTFKISNSIVVVARAVQMLPDVYSKLIEYGDIESYEYWVFKMEVLDPLGSNLPGEFYYAVRLNDVVDECLMEYESLLISMIPLGYDFVMKNDTTDTLVSFDIMLETGGWNQLAGLIPFTDGVLDESLWQKSRWTYLRYLEYHTPDGGGRGMWYPIRLGSTLDEAVANIYAEWKRITELYESRKDNFYPQILHEPDFKTDEGKELAELVDPFVNGIFGYELSWFTGGVYFVDYRRYIGGCPTNEGIHVTVNTETGKEEILRVGIPFEDSDFEGLPDIGAYIESIDLESVEPEHIDPTGKKLLIKSANGWYEKTESGVYSIVKISWIYQKEDDYYIHYQDETFILLDSRGAKKVSREELIELIGKNQNIYGGEYGEEDHQPMI